MSASFNRSPLVAALLEARRERRTRLELPELGLGGVPLVVYLAPLSVYDTISNGAALSGEDRFERVTALFRLLVANAQDEAGAPVFYVPAGQGAVAQSLTPQIIDQVAADLMRALDAQALHSLQERLASALVVPVSSEVVEGN